MRGDVFLKFLYNKCVDDVWLIVRHADAEELVEGQQVACSAGGGKLYWRHVGTAHGVAALERPGFHRVQYFLTFCGDVGVYVIWFGVGPGGCDGFRAMAIGTR